MPSLHDLLARPSPTAGVGEVARSAVGDERQAIVETARAWGYFSGGIKTRKDLWHGRNVLDVGMGAGPHSISFIEGGARSYVGVDPLIGSEHVRDFRSDKDPTIPAYHAFPHSPADIMRAFPAIHLYPGTIEEQVENIARHDLDIALLAAVTEHLRDPYTVIRGIWQCLRRRGHIWICHCNYYSWTGHHRPPRTVAAWRRDDPEEARHVDWRHLEPDHPDYTNTNYNRIRLEDLRLVVAKYFEIIEWKVTPHAIDRLTPEIRARWRMYSLAELLGQNVYITGQRRDVPLDIDLSDRELFHPSLRYRAERDYSAEDLEPFRLLNSVYFTAKGEICSHSDNDHAGERVFERLSPGDRIALSKFTSRVVLTVASVERPAGARPRLRVVEALPEALTTWNRDQWTIET